MRESPSQSSIDKIRALCGQMAESQSLDEATRDELCGHLEDKLAGYLSGDVKITEEDALLLVRAHFGDAERIGRQLEGVRKETVMSRWLWMLACAGLFSFVAVISPEMSGAMGVWLMVLAGMAIERIWQSDSAFSRDLRAGWPLYFGPIAILCGPAIILPALAKIKQERIPFIQAFGPLLLGSIILLAGFYFLTVGIRRKWAKTA